MTSKKKVGFTADVCPHCQQTTNYITGVDRGMAAIVRAFGNAVRAKGVNVLHPLKELAADPGMSVAQAVAAGKLTGSMSRNTSRARSHGLLARIEGRAGNWCLTKKGVAFLRGEPVPKYAIIDKVTGHTAGYYEPETYTASIRELDPSAPFWSETINEGRVVPANEI